MQLRHSLLALLLLPLLLPDAAAQTLTIGSGEVRRGGTIEIPVRFEAGAVPAAGYDLWIVYDPTRFDPPTCTVADAFPAAGACAVRHGEGRIGFIFFTHDASPLVGGTHMLVTLPVPRRAPRGVALLGGDTPHVVSPSGGPVPYTIHTGQIDIR